MEIQKFLASIVLIFSANTFAKEGRVNHADCRKFYHSDKPWRVHGGVEYGSWGGVDGFNKPFEIEDNGDIKLHKNSSFKVKDSINGGETTAIKYPSRGKTRQVTIERDRNHNIIQITHSGDHTWTRPLSDHMPFPIKTIYRFEQKNGQCVPAEGIQEYKNPYSADFPPINLRLYDIGLCRDIEQFFKRHPKLKACADSRLNEKMKAIIYARLPKITLDARVERLGSVKSDVGFGDASIRGSVEETIYLASRARGSGPISTALVVQNNSCRRLKKFVRNSGLWKKPGASSSQRKGRSVLP